MFKKVWNYDILKGILFKMTKIFGTQESQLWFSILYIQLFLCSFVTFLIACKALCSVPGENNRVPQTAKWESLEIQVSGVQNEDQRSGSESEFGSQYVGVPVEAL